MKRRQLNKNFVDALLMTLGLVVGTFCLYISAEMRDDYAVEAYEEKNHQEQIDFTAKSPATIKEIVVIEDAEVPRREKVETMYDLFTDEEVLMLEAVIQKEAGCFSKKYKSLTAEAIYNRLVSEDFPDNVSELLLADEQFTGFKSYWNSGKYIQDIDNETKEVVKEVFSQHKTSHEAVFYYNPEYSTTESIEWFENSGDLIYLFSYDEIGYTTRFFKENEKDR